MSYPYTHGYTASEDQRLIDQATTLTELLHHDTRYPPGSTVLEAGCGVGAQTVVLAANSPGARFTSVDIAPDSLAAARGRVARRALTNVEFRQADLYELPFPGESFDHLFLCFVLEHLSDPARALARLRPKLKPGGTITAIEGDHESTSFHPPSAAAWRNIRCLIDLQARNGGDSQIGRRLYPLLSQAGFEAVRVSPRFVYVDASRPERVEGFTRRTYIAMVDGVREAAIAAGMSTPEAWAEGIRDLERTTAADGVFCYTFFKAVGRKE